MKRKIGKQEISSRAVRGRQASKSRFPAHLRVDTPEEWRGLKRTEWREVTQALERFQYGSAYVPSCGVLYEIGRLTRQMTEAIEAEGWIAW